MKKKLKIKRKHRKTTLKTRLEVLREMAKQVMEILEQYRDSSIDEGQREVLKDWECTLGDGIENDENKSQNHQEKIYQKT